MIRLMGLSHREAGPVVSSSHLSP